MRKPRIGIMLDWQEGRENAFSRKDHYALREGYFEAVRLVGGVPFGIEPRVDMLADTLDNLDGLVVPGGSFATPPDWYVQPHSVTRYHPRPTADMAYIAEAIRRDMPLLGICAGCQELAVALQGNLMWKMVDSVPDLLLHKHPDPTQVAHTVQVAGDSLLHRLVGTELIEVNSHHNGGIASAGLARVSGTAPDGVVEAIEGPGRHVLGVMWHPEYFVTPADHAVWNGFATACDRAA